MGNDKKSFKFEEVAEHDKASDCWIVIHGKVYDVTTFLTEHPGGEEIILGCTGRDATKEFEESDHSNEAKKLKEKYYIGVIDSSSNVPIQPYLITSKNIGLNPDERYGFAPPKVVVHMLLLVLVLGAAFLTQVYTRGFKESVVSA